VNNTIGNEDVSLEQLCRVDISLVKILGNCNATAVVSGDKSRICSKSCRVHQFRKDVVVDKRT